MKQFYLKNAILALIIFFTAFMVNAQCPTGDVILDTQAKVNDFLVQYPNCTQLPGSIRIGVNNGTSDISGLTPLGNLTSIGGNLNIYHNSHLTDFSGLRYLTSVGGNLDFLFNSAITDITEFTNLTSIGGNLQFRTMTGLVNLSGFNSLSNIGGRVYIFNNGLLTSINGFSTIQQIGTNLDIQNNPQLATLNGFYNLNIVGGYFRIQENANLTNLNGLGNLKNISTWFNIINNAKLENLNGLSNLNSVGQDIYIDNNAVLNDISSLQNTIFFKNANNGLTITNNPLLTVCDFFHFCAYLANPASTHPRNISGNGGDCMDEASLQQACTPCTVTNLTTSNANNCQSSNGSVSFTLAGDCLFSLDGFYWSAATNPNVTLSNLSARDYFLFVAKRSASGFPDFSTLKIQQFSIGTNSVTVGGNIVVNCSPDITLPHSTTNFTRFVLPQFYGVCGVTNTKISKLEGIRPDGTTFVDDPFDPSIPQGLTPRQEGNYQIKWTITGQNGNTTITKTCTQIITVKKNADAKFKSAICNGSPVRVQPCSVNTLVATTYVSGLNTLDYLYGLKNVKINANFPGNFNGVINLVAPDGTKFALTQGTDFPQFDGSKQTFIANFTSCYASSNPNVSDNTPFILNGTYRARQDLVDINYQNINPNGVWGLEVCASTNIAWNLNCFELEFGELCPTLLDYTIIGGCSASDKGSVSISLSQIKGSYCDDPENDGLLNYMMYLENVETVLFKPNEQTIKIEAVPGTYKLDFGRYFINNGIPSWSCNSTYTITIPVIDNQKPLIIGCRPNQTLQLGANGTVNYTAVNPTAVTDNCGLQSKGLNVIFYGGATNANGQTLEAYPNFDIGSQHTFTIVGKGWVDVEYWATDHAGNTTLCKHRLTVLGDPCVNDRTRPVYTLCPQSQLAVLDNNDYARVNVTDPFLSDNCNVVKESLELFYLNGTHDNNNNTYTIYNNVIDPGGTYDYNINKEGYVIFKYTAEDAAGNKGYCFSYVTTVKNTAPCGNDITPPVITNCPSDITLSLDANGEAILDLKDPDVFDNCLISSLTLSINCVNGATVLDGTTLYYPNFSPGAKFTYDFKGAGTSYFVYSAADQNGNIATCQFKVTTVPQGQEALFNFGNICASPGVPTYVPVTINRFNKIGAFSFDAYFANTTGIKFIGINNANITNVSSNILSNGTLRISWDEPGGNDITLADNFKLFDIVIESDINFINPTQLLGRDLAILSSGSSNGIINAADICVGFNAHPKGIIKSASNIAHSDVNVDLLSGLVQIGHTTTTANGSYSFTKTNYTNRVQPLKNDEWRKGVDILDVARIRRHFLQTDILNDNYKILAADVNKDGKINVLDVAYTNRLFLHKINEFPNNTSWRFIPEALGANFDPLNVNIPEFINLNDPNVDDTKLNFISVKTGDVDNNALLRNEYETSTRSVLALNISLPDTVVNAGTNIRIPVKVNGLDSISIMSMVINFDYKQLVLKDIESDKIPGFSNSNFNDLGDRVLIGWDHPQVKSISAEGVLLTLVFETKNMVGVSPLEMSDINMYTRDFNKINVIAQNGTLAYGTSSTESWTITKFLKAYPNPFSGSIQILAALPQQEDYTLQVYDVNGKLIFTKFVDRINYKQPVLLDNFPNSGVYLINLRSNSINENLKIVHMD